MDRREFLLATSTVAAAGCVPHAPIGTLDDPVDDAAVIARIGAIRVGMDRAGRRFESWLDRFPTRPKGTVVDAYRDALPALHAYGAIGGMSVEAQVHPATQALTREVFDTLLPAVRVLRTWFGKLGPERLAALDERVRNNPGLLDDAIGLVGAQVGAEAPHDDARDRVGRLLERVHWQISRRGFSRVLPETTDRYDRVQRGSARPMAPPEVEARVEQARRRWGVDDDDATCSGGHNNGVAGAVVAVFGALGTGTGAVLIIAGAALMASSPDCICIGLFVLLVGLAVLVVGIVMLAVGVAMTSSANERRMPDGGGPTGPTPEDTAPPPPDAIPVAADAGWVTTPFVVEPGTRWLISAVGTIGVGRDTVSPEGSAWNAEAGAPVPGLPLGILVGRIGQTLFAIKRVGTTPEGAAGPLELSANLAAYDRNEATGAFYVTAVALQHAAEPAPAPEPTPEAIPAP